MRQVNFTEWRALMPLPGVTVRQFFVWLIVYLTFTGIMWPFISKQSFVLLLASTPIVMLITQFPDLISAYAHYERTHLNRGFWRVLWEQNIVERTLFLNHEGVLHLFNRRVGSTAGLYIPLGTGFQTECLFRCVDRGRERYIANAFTIRIDWTRNADLLPVIMIDDRYGGKRYFSMWQLQRLFSQGVFSEHNLSQLERVTDLPS